MSLALAHHDLAEIDLEALRRQEAPSFELLVRQHQSLVMGLAQSLGLHRADMDDAAAEVFAAVYRALPRFRGDAALSTWVYRIAWRTMLKMRLRRRTEGESLNDHLPSRGDSPEAQASKRESTEALWSAVAALPRRQAMAVELHYRRGWPVERIASVMECPTGTVKTLLFRARKRLRECLDERELTP